MLFPKSSPLECNILISRLSPLCSVFNLTKMDAAEPGQDIDYPGQPAPGGLTPQIVNPESIVNQVYITAGVCLTLMVVFSLTRLLSKICFGPRTIKMDESENPPTSRLEFTPLTLRP